MRTLSTLIKNVQAQAEEAVTAQLLSITPEWVDALSLVAASTHRIHLVALIAGEDWQVILTPSFHGIHVKVLGGSCQKTQSRLSKDLALRLNY